MNNYQGEVLVQASVVVSIQAESMEEAWEKLNDGKYRIIPNSHSGNQPIGIYHDSLRRVESKNWSWL